MNKTRTALGFMAIADEYKAFALLNRYETRVARRYHQVLSGPENPEESTGKGRMRNELFS